MGFKNVFNAVCVKGGIVNPIIEGIGFGVVDSMFIFFDANDLFNVFCEKEANATCPTVEIKNSIGGFKVAECSYRPIEGFRLFCIGLEK